MGEDIEQEISVTSTTESVEAIEYNYRIIQRGNRFMAMKRSGNEGEWTPLLLDYTLPTSAIGVIESEMVRDIYKRGNR